MQAHLSHRTSGLNGSTHADGAEKIMGLENLAGAILAAPIVLGDQRIPSDSYRVEVGIKTGLAELSDELARPFRKRKRRPAGRQPEALSEIWR
jgi:hypothetical protein